MGKEASKVGVLLKKASGSCNKTGRLSSARAAGQGTLAAATLREAYLKNREGVVTSFVPAE